MKLWIFNSRIKAFGEFVSPNILAQTKSDFEAFSGPKELRVFEHEF